MKKLGFTLAEVLITLVIIGVIAAMTVPSLMQNTNAQEYKSALKKAISGLNQALQLEYALNGRTAGDFENEAALVNELFKVRMSVMEGGDANKFTDVESGCTNAWTTQDGIKFCIANFNNAGAENDEGACNVYNTEPCGGSESEPNIYIDVNGDRKPNALTSNANRPKDGYKALLFAQKVVPVGDATQGVMYDKQTAAHKLGGGETTP